MACVDRRCRDPCEGACGRGARCQVIAHSPICTCNDGLTGDPFTYCYPTPGKDNNKTLQKIVITIFLQLFHAYNIKTILIFQYLHPHRLIHVNPLLVDLTQYVLDMEICRHAAVNRTLLDLHRIVAPSVQ